MNSSELEVLGMTKFGLGSLLNNVVTMEMQKCYNFLQFDTQAVKDHISKDRSSPFSSYYDKKSKILGSLHGILIEDTDGILINPGPMATAILHRERV